MFKKRLLKPVLGVALSCALLVPVLAVPVMAAEFADDAVIDDALVYLEGVQAADGSIGSYSDSAWAAMAIAAAEEDPNGFGNSSLVDYLKDSASQQVWEMNPVTGIARVVLAAVAACDDPSAFGSGDPTYVPDGDYLAKLKEFHNDTQFVYEGCLEYDPVTYECITFGTVDDTLNDDIWGLMALAAAGEDLDSDIVTSTVAFIKDNQGEDGGWSWATFGNPMYWESDVDDTAAGIMALIAAGEPQDSLVIEDALLYFQDNQDASGGFLSWGAVSLSSTSWAVDAIVAAGGDPTSAEWAPDGINPVEYIMICKTVLEDGSFTNPAAWSPNPQKDTSDAIIALTGSFYPIIPQCAEFIFEDPVRGTTLAIIDSDEDTFRFTAPDGFDSGVVEADFMRIRRGRITLFHNDSDIFIIARANIKRDWCLGSLYDKDNHKRYIIRDPRGVE